MMQFANPIWLWGLTALIIPIGIHFLSRKEGKVIRFGSLRHLQESSTARFKGLKLNEILLLLIRCAFVLLLVFLLAGIELSGFNGGPKRWLLLDRGLENEPTLESLYDSLKRNNYEFRYLATGFPLLKDSAFHNEPTGYWALVNELKTEPVEDIVVISHNYLSRFKGMHLSIPDNIRWISVPAKPLDFTVSVVRFLPDSVFVRNGRSTRAETWFTTERIKLPEDLNYYNHWSLDSIRITNGDSIDITIVADRDFAYDAQVLQASLQAVSSASPHKITIVQKSPEQIGDDITTDWVIFLTHQKPKIETTANMISFGYCGGENVPLLVRAKTCYNNEVRDADWIITKRLHDDIALQQNLTFTLAAVVLADTSDSNILLNDRRMLPEEFITANREESTAAPESSESAQPVFAILLLLLCMIERWSAFKKNQ